MNSLFRTVPFVFLYVFLATALLNAQRNTDIKTSVFDEINASAAIKSKATFNMKGNIKSVNEFMAASNDSNYFEFNNSGLLILTKLCASGKSSCYKTITTYSFENNHLKHIKTESDYRRNTEEKFYDATGHLIKAINEWNRHEEKFHQEVAYIYSESFSNVTLMYAYKPQNKNLDLVLKDEYKFTKDSNGRIKRIRHISTHSDTEYGYTATFNYDTISGRLITVTHRSDCAGSNSCLDLRLTIQYDANGNIIGEHLSDFTVRNATWSFGYNYKAKYNEHNDVSEELRMHENSSGYFTNAKTIDEIYETQKLVYEYEYDVKGNWTKKFMVSDTSRKLLVQRLITYFD